MTTGAKERAFCKVAARLAGDLLRCKMEDGGTAVSIAKPNPVIPAKSGIDPQSFPYYPCFRYAEMAGDGFPFSREGRNVWRMWWAR